MLTLIAEYSGFIRLEEMRYHLVGMLPFTLTVTAGLYGLYLFRRWLGLLVLLWVIAGAVFQQMNDWSKYVDWEYAHKESPLQVVSRLALQAEQQPIIIGYRYRSILLEWPGHINYTRRSHYFDLRDIVLEVFHDIERIENNVRYKTITESSIWVFYQISKVDAAEAAEIESIMDNLNHQLCDTIEIGIDTVIRQYAWKTLDCQPPQLLSRHQTSAIDYRFYGAALHAAESKLYFSDQWTARTDNGLSDFQMSYQLISADWNQAAQLDLPLVHEDQLRLFSIDIGNVPAGTYRLMAILYDKHSGQRQNWLNSEDDPPDMLNLTDIDIP